MVNQHVLDVLIELGRRRRDEAAVAAAAARRLTGQVAETIEQLEGYRQDYASRSPIRQQAVTATVAIERHQAFIDRLDLAVREQHQRHDLARRHEARSDDALMQTQRRLKTFELLQKRQLEARQRRQERIEQQITDELAARRSLRRISR